MEEELREKHNEFRIGVKQTEGWKIKSIAALKKKNIKQPVVAEEIYVRKPIVEEAPQHEAKPAHQQQSSAPNAAIPSSSTSAIKEEAVQPVQKSSSSSAAPNVKPAPTEATLARQAEAALIQKSLQLEQALRELDHYSHNSHSAQERIRQLHQMRSSLLWLLKKAARHERLIVHENLSAFAANNP